MGAPEARAQSENGNSPPIEVGVEGTVEAPFARVRETLLALEAFGRWFPAISEWRVLERQDDSARVYGRQSLPWPVADRDYVVEYRWGDDATGFWLRAVAQRDAPPVAPSGVVRVERMQTEWRIEAAASGTSVRYRFEGDAGGSLPEWAARVGWRSSTPRVLDGLRHELSESFR